MEPSCNFENCNYLTPTFNRLHTLKDIINLTEKKTAAPILHCKMHYDFNQFLTWYKQIITGSFLLWSFRNHNWRSNASRFIFMWRLLKKINSGLCLGEQIYWISILCQEHCVYLFYFLFLTVSICGTLIPIWQMWWPRLQVIKSVS